MDFLQNLTDDQTAILGCAGLLFAAFVTMSVSYHVGVIVRGGRASQTSAAAERPATVASQSHRRAA